ncbi:MAG: glycoside hydrolase family 97 N-terminal domain-containing protein, partial [Mediterranea sp.]|nr:glycoside hydrolase family 97 N-terminal domain-containing protein [Mediterranea sp.]
MKLKELGIICLLTFCSKYSAYSENRLVVYPAPAPTFGLQAQDVDDTTCSRLTSPNGKYVFETCQKHLPDGGKQLYYTLSFGGKEVVRESELGVLIENQLFESALAIPNDSCKTWTANLNLIETRTSSADSIWKPVYGERAAVRDHYNQLELAFLKGNNTGKNSNDSYDKRRYYKMNIIVRAYNQGIAFRYFFPEADNGLFLHIVGEQTQFVMPEGTMAYYENWAQGPYHYLPLKDWPGESERPLTMKLSNGLTVALTEAQMTDYARMKFCLAKENTLKVSLYGSVDVITPYSTPWRVIMAGEKATELIANNDIILNLNTENKIKDTSWIRPGKAIRVGKLTQADAMKCVDFAAERGLQ